ncbi:hypothetical protein GEV33_000328 [Tenebrio molitor]|uniref:Reverse transcriptase domain-containing protein n=1 Tax=Tenebrio molitor TaxID=7067 RepID=A0A8J6HYN6_TENMO|nr:hypothetical protein GEV33_000328 [Tenebrio molitor]
MARALRSNKKPLPPIHGMRELVLSNDEKAEAFADSLELQYRQTSPTLTWITSRKFDEEVEDILSTQNETVITPTSPAEVRQIIEFLKVKKAPGPDNIPNKAWKLLPDKVVVALTTVINASLRFWQFPSRWKIGEVLETVILTRLVRVTNENGVLPDEQFGFRPQHSTSDQLIHVTEFISKGSSFTTCCATWMMAPHLNLTPGDVKQMMEEREVLRELVVTLRKERDDTLALLATSDVRSRIEEEDDDDPEMDVSPSTPPSPESDQAEPSTSVEEIVEPENGAPFIEVRTRQGTSIIGSPKGQEDQVGPDPSGLAADAKQFGSHAKSGGKPAARRE